MCYCILTVLSIYSSERTLLKMLAAGMSNVHQETIVPLISVFCSLFTYSLLSLHDSEFYGDASGDFFKSIFYIV